MIKTAKDYIENQLKDEVIDYNNPNCNNCNDCCSLNVMLTKEEYEFYIKHFKKNKKVLVELAQKHREKGKKVKAINFMCPFTSKGRKCLIYNIRPQICKDFHCKPQLNKPNHLKEYHIEPHKTINDIFKHFKISLF